MRSSAASSAAYRLVFNTGGNDERFSGPELDVACLRANRDATLQDQEEIVSVVVVVPDELALDLDNHHVVAVELGNRGRGAQCSWNWESFSDRLTARGRRR